MKLIQNDNHGRMYVKELTPAQIEAGWYEVTPEVIEEPKAEDAIDFDAMTKKELEIYARDFNIELDRRMTKKNMLADFNEQLGD